MAVRILGTNGLCQRQELRPRKAVRWPHHCCQPRPALHTSGSLHLLFPQPEASSFPPRLLTPNPTDCCCLRHCVRLNICLHLLYSGCSAQGVAGGKQKVVKAHATALGTLFSEMHYSGASLPLNTPHNRKPFPSWVSSLLKDIYVMGVLPASIFVHYGACMVPNHRKGHQVSLKWSYRQL